MVHKLVIKAEVVVLSQILTMLRIAGVDGYHLPEGWFLRVSAPFVWGAIEYNQGGLTKKASSLAG